MENKLKPCPFCGGKATLNKIRVSNSEHYWHSISIACYADKCRINPETLEYNRIDFAIKAWNRRVK